jgi:hypothetical protein
MGAVTVKDSNKLKAACVTLAPFISKQQAMAMVEVLRGEEGAWMEDKIIEYAERIREMPSSPASDGAGPVAWLHYFGPSCDWYIFEKDGKHDAQLYAFGVGDLGCPEIGTISIQEIVSSGFVELDLYWTPCTLDALNQRKGYDFATGSEAGNETDG